MSARLGIPEPARMKHASSGIGQHFFAEFLFDSLGVGWHCSASILTNESMAELVGNLLVAQSGGPTCAINASLAGVITEAGKNECIEEIYGGLNGILGI